MSDPQYMLLCGTQPKLVSLWNTTKTHETKICNDKSRETNSRCPPKRDIYHIIYGKIKIKRSPLGSFFLFQFPVVFPSKIDFKRMFTDLYIFGIVLYPYSFACFFASTFHLQKYLSLVVSSQGIFPKFRGEFQKYLSCHQLELIFPLKTNILTPKMEVDGRWFTSKKTAWRMGQHFNWWFRASTSLGKFLSRKMDGVFIEADEDSTAAGGGREFCMFPSVSFGVTTPFNNHTRRGF